MKRVFLFILLALSGICRTIAQNVDTSFITPFERSGGKETATYDEVTDFFIKLQRTYPHLLAIGEMGPADNGYPLRYVAYTNDGQLDPSDFRKSNKLVILVNNAIHPGEPDGVDASMMLIRDAVTGRIKIPDNVLLVVVPVFNIGGALNRNSHSRANQNGPLSYGFRGNSRNLDLNRDFIKCDAAQTLGMTDLFSRVDPDLFIDNHVSNGADYQHVMTLLPTQHDKLGGSSGKFMYEILTPEIYKDMKSKGYDLIPYVNNFSNTPENGWKEFYESPRYLSGYAALSRTMAYVAETHMLKPFADRVKATYALMNTLINVGSKNAAAIISAREADRIAQQKQTEFALDWRLDTTQCDSIVFKGYASGYKPSKVSGLQRLYYDRSKPYTKTVPFYDHYVPSSVVTAPRAYIIPKTWTPIIVRLRNNGVRIQRVSYDSLMEVTAYRIDSFKTTPTPYESHYLHSDVHVTPYTTKIQVKTGDYIVWLRQSAKRFLIETLEPTAPDAFFAWNFFDGILQQKEYFSSYVFEDLAAEILDERPELRKLLEEKRKADPDFAKDARSQLNFVYQHSDYMEPEYMRYPVYRIEN